MHKKAYLGDIALVGLPTLMGAGIGAYTADEENRLRNALMGGVAGALMGTGAAIGKHHLRKQLPEGGIQEFFQQRMSGMGGGAPLGKLNPMEEVGAGIKPAGGVSDDAARAQEALKRLETGSPEIAKELDVRVLTPEETAILASGPRGTA